MASTPTKAAAPTFKVEKGIELPAATRGGRKGEPSPYATIMQAMTPASGKNMQSFFVPAAAPDGITDAAERTKAFNDNARKLTNRIGGLARRLKKTDPTRDYAIRVMPDGDRIGVRVFCVAPAAAT